MSQSIRPRASPGPYKSCVGNLGQEGPAGGARHKARSERETAASPTGGTADRRTGNGEPQSIRWTATSPGSGGRSSGPPAARLMPPMLRRERRPDVEHGEPRTDRAGRAWQAKPRPPPVLVKAEVRIAIVAICGLVASRPRGKTVSGLPQCGWLNRRYVGCPCKFHRPKDASLVSSALNG
jgi:hypothetical protein